MTWLNRIIPWRRRRRHCPDRDAIARSEEALRAAEQQAGEVEQISRAMGAVGHRLRRIREQNGFSDWLLGGDPDAPPGR
ncbi:DUF7620 family protein [Allonocardiopsis opalescens]|uniref:Uncharacterized protein n=1 Tax=Allonocardiopsis opalescens TaxID=1144618 RepID=A0A2T0PVV5_9ACTN|nr:hypothetical protein [Allonocardiopsis opalescens]PRX95560.1 hypothetical protein CLV72_109169 [Allonocardiopsis opalescens]